MTSLDLTLLVIVAAVTTVAPMWIGWRRMESWGRVEAAYWIAAVAIYSTIRTFSIDLPEPLIFSAAFVSRLAMFTGFVLSGEREGRGLRWSPLHAALASLLVYALLVPHVLQWPIDGDEPYFVLIAESVLHDRDLDLGNQYEDLESSVTGRPDLVPQMGDPTSPQGEVLSRHEPFLSLLLIPGLVVAGLPGAVWMIALLGAALVYSVLKLIEEWGYGDQSGTLVWPALAFSPPVLFYSVRIWAEVPGALALSEALRAMRARSWTRFVFWLLVLSLLQLRFVVIAAALVALAVWRERPRWRTIAASIGALVVPLVVLWFVAGSPLGVHRGFEFLPASPMAYFVGAAGLLIDAQNGMLFQAPLILLALAVLVADIRSGRPRTGIWLVAIPYLLLLLPRTEWHGGWSPPLRYLVVFTPLFGLALARARHRWPSALVALAAVWTAGLVVHGIAFPWRLFSIADGQSVLGAWLSHTRDADLSRLLPSLVRPNLAAAAWAGLLVAAVLTARFRMVRIGPRFGALAVSLAIVIGSLAVLAPPRIVHLEDAHVVHRGGEPYPGPWVEARFRFRGGWAMEAGSVASFRLQPGPAIIHYASAEGAEIEVEGRRWILPPTDGYGRLSIELAEPDITMTLTSGSAIIDRIQHD